MNFFHDGVPKEIDRLGAVGEKQVLTGLSGFDRGDDTIYDFDLLPLSDAEVFVEFDGLAMDFAMQRVRQDSSERSDGRNGGTTRRLNLPLEEHKMRFVVGSIHLAKQRAPDIFCAAHDC